MIGPLRGLQKNISILGQKKSLLLNPRLLSPIQPSFHITCAMNWDSADSQVKLVPNGVSERAVFKAFPDPKVQKRYQNPNRDFLLR